jgi:hypothetical protein
VFVVKRCFFWRNLSHAGKLGLDECCARTRGSRILDLNCDPSPSSSPRSRRRGKDPVSRFFTRTDSRSSSPFRKGRGLR